jgi:hypothetical protein
VLEKQDAAHHQRIAALEQTLAVELSYGTGCGVGAALPPAPAGEALKSSWVVSYRDKNAAGVVAVTVARRDRAAAAAPGTTALEDDDMIIAPTTEEYSFDASRVRGVLFAPWLRASRWEALAKEVQLRDSDIVVATYPKRYRAKMRLGACYFT